METARREFLQDAALAGAAITTCTLAEGNRLAQSQSDAAVATGDVCNDGKKQYLYDAAERLCAASSSGMATGYLYDAAGNRVAKGSSSTWSCEITTSDLTQAGGTP